MKSFLAATTFALALAGVPSGVSADTPDDTATSSTGAPIAFGTSHVIRSEVLGEDRTLNIWLPPHHDDAEAPYTVLYLIDGGQQQDYPHIAGLAQLGVISWQYEPLIVVGIETGERIHELTPQPADERYLTQFPTSGGAGTFRRYIAEEVVPFIEENYRTGDRRAVIGESLAGLFIVDTMLEEPGLFDDYIAVSPSLWWDDQAVAGRAAERLAGADHDGHRVYLTMGDEGGTMQAGLDTLLTALDNTAGAPEFVYIDRRNSESHSTIYHGAAFDALRRFYARPPWDYGDMPWYLVEGGQPEPQAGAGTEAGAEE